MYKLKLKKCLSYQGNGVRANRAEPFVTVKTKAESDRLVATKRFELIDVIDVDNNNNGGDSGGTVDFGENNE
jgi:hypothetical protein